MSTVRDRNGRAPKPLLRSLWSQLDRTSPPPAFCVPQVPVYLLGRARRCTESVPTVKATIFEERLARFGIPGWFSRTPRISRSGLLSEARAPYSEHHVSKVAIVNSRYEILQRLILFSGVRLVVSAAEGWGEVQVRAFILIVLGGALF